jgi:hypothetical protein
MSAAAVLRIVTEGLQKAGISYMLTGSFVSNFHGRPRSTADIDFVIAASPEQLKVLIQHLREQNYYAQVDDALDAWRHQSMFNVIDTSMAWKIDFIIRKPEAFSREAFQRRVPTEIEGTLVDIATAEDIVIAKLAWAKQGQSLRQIEDVAGILKIRGKSMDYSYINRWVVELGLLSQWNDARQQAGVE